MIFTPIVILVCGLCCMCVVIVVCVLRRKKRRAGYKLQLDVGTDDADNVALLANTDDATLQ